MTLCGLKRSRALLLLVVAMDGAAGGAMMHGLLGKIGILTLGEALARMAIATTGRSGGGMRGALTRPMSSVGSSDELLRQARLVCRSY